MPSAKIVISDVKMIHADLQRFMRHYCLPSEAQEMICSALKPDTKEVLCKVAVDYRGIAGAISYQIYPDRLHVHALGSLAPGVGTLLMAAVGKLARRRHLPVTVGATQRSRGFYIGLGFVDIEVVGKAVSSTRSIINMTKNTPVSSL